MSEQGMRQQVQPPEILGRLAALSIDSVIDHQVKAQVVYVHTTRGAEYVFLVEALPVSRVWVSSLLGPSLDRFPPTVHDLLHTGLFHLSSSRVRTEIG
jgi:hypothetical protein